MDWTPNDDLFCNYLLSGKFHKKIDAMFREAPTPKFGTTGVFDWNEAKKMQFAIFRNISDVYTKVDYSEM